MQSDREPKYRSHLLSELQMVFSSNNETGLQIFVDLSNGLSCASEMKLSGGANASVPILFAYKVESRPDCITARY